MELDINIKLSEQQIKDIKKDIENNRLSYKKLQ
jgi:hypothetical protein